MGALDGRGLRSLRNSLRCLGDVKIDLRTVWSTVERSGQRSQSTLGTKEAATRTVYFRSPVVSGFEQGVYSRVDHKFFMDESKDLLSNYLKEFDLGASRQKALMMYMDMLKNNVPVFVLIDSRHIYIYLESYFDGSILAEESSAEQIEYISRLYEAFKGLRYNQDTKTLILFHKFFSSKGMLEEMHDVENSVRCNKLSGNMFSTLCMQAAYAYAFQGEISKALQVVSVEDLRYTIALKKCLYSVLDGLCKGNKAPLDVVDHFFKWHYYPRYPSHSKAILLYANYLLDSKDCSKCTAMFQLAAKAYVLTVPICYTVLRAALQLNLIKDAVYLHLFMEAISKNDANRKICEEARKILFEGGHIADPLVHPVIDSRVFSLEDARNLFSSSFEEYSMDWKTGTVDSALLPPATIDEQPGATDTRGIYKQPGATATSDN